MGEAKKFRLNLAFTFKFYDKQRQEYLASFFRLGKTMTGEIFISPASFGKPQTLPTFIQI
jgi:hypothetical protein